jgi:hypothetical protein
LIADVVVVGSMYSMGMAGDAIRLSYIKLTNIINKKMIDNWVYKTPLLIQ